MAQPVRRHCEQLGPPEARQPLRLNSADRQRVVVRFLKGLPAVERRVLSLSFHERLGEEEIASLTAMPVDQVSARLRKLLHAVEAALLAEDEALWQQLGRRRSRA